MAVKKILVGFDGSRGSFRALDEAVQLAGLCHAEVHTISVIEIPHGPSSVDEVNEAKEEAEEKFQTALRKARVIAESEGIELQTTVTVYVGHEVKSIVAFIKHEQFDLLVIGVERHSALYDRVMGSTCQALVRQAPCMVLVVK